MKDYTKPSINIASFGVTNIVTTSDTYKEDAGKTNQANAEAYLSTDFAKTNTVMSFMDQ